MDYRIPVESLVIVYSFNRFGCIVHRHTDRQTDRHTDAETWMNALLPATDRYVSE